MANNIYPDLSKGTYDMPYARRKILASDLFIRGQAFSSGRLTETGDDLLDEPGNPNDGSDDPTSEGGNCCGVLPPDDLELDVIEVLLGDDDQDANLDQLPATLAEAYISRFKNYGVKLYRNYVEQQFGIDYIWFYRENLLRVMVPFEVTERFTFHGIMNPLDMYQETEYPALASADNINSFQIGNNTVFLSTFIGARIRLFRNEVLQSFVNHYTWNTLSGELVLMIAPEETETFKVIPY